MAKVKDEVKGLVGESEAKPQASLAKDEIEITHPDQLQAIQDKNKLAGFSGWFFTKKVKNAADEGEHEIRIPSVSEKGEYVFVKGAKAICKIIPVILLALGLMVGQAFATVAATDESVMGVDRWSIQNDGDMVPGSDSDYTIGATGAEVQNIYTDSIVVNGTTYTSFAAGTDGNWTGTGSNVTLDGAPTKFIATFSSGDFFATGFTVDTGDITFGQGGKIDGDTNGTIKLIEASDTLSFIFSGTTIQLDSSDGGFQFALSNAGEGQVDFLTNADTDDYLVVKTVADVPTIATLGTSNLVIAPDGGGTSITGTLAVSGVTTSAGVTTTSTVTLSNSETIVNSTDGTVQVGGSATTILSVLSTGTTDEDGILLLRSDNSTDNGDDWQMVADGATDDMLFQNDTSGSMVTKLTIADSGLVTTVADVVIAGTTPMITVGDAGAEDSSVVFDGNAQDYYIGLEDATDDLIIGLGSTLGTTPIISMSDVGHTIVTGSTDGILTVLGAGATASDAYIRLLGDIDTDAKDGWQIWNDSSAATLFFGNDTTTPGTFVTMASLDSAGTLTVQGIEGAAGEVEIWADNGDDAIDKVVFAVADGGALTMTTGAVTGYTVSAAGLVSLPNSNTLGDAITDVNTFTGKIAGATPMSFDGTTADTVYTILAITDPTSTSKTVTVPAVTGTVELKTAATTVITADTTASIVVVPGTDQFYTYTIDTDNEDCTLTFSAGGTAHDQATIMFITDAAGSADEVMTFETTLANPAGTLTLANVASDRYIVTFMSDGTVWNETSRTAVLTT